MPKIICAGCEQPIDAGSALYYEPDKVYLHMNAKRFAEFSDKNLAIFRARNGNQPIPNEAMEQSISGDCVFAYLFRGHAVANLGLKPVDISKLEETAQREG